MNYTGAGISKYVEKVLDDSASATDVIVPVTIYSREYTDTFSVNENISLRPEKVFAESLTTSDVFLYEVVIPLNLFDTVHADDDIFIESELSRESILDDTTNTDITVINNSKGLEENITTAEVYISNISKEVSENVSIGDSGIITIQDYSDPTYFSEDYVGESYTI